MTSFVIPQRDDDLLIPSTTYYRVGPLLKDTDRINSALKGSVLLATIYRVNILKTFIILRNYITLKISWN